jgi:hypothetical protein
MEGVAVGEILHAGTMASEVIDKNLSKSTLI